MESRKNSSSIPFVIPRQWVHLIIVMIFFFVPIIKYRAFSFVLPSEFPLATTFSEEEAPPSPSAAGPRRLPAKGSFRPSRSCSRERRSASSFCLPPGGFPFWAHLGLSLKGTLKIQDSVFITGTHLLNMRLHLESYTNKLTLVLWEWFFSLSLSLLLFIFIF